MEEREFDENEAISYINGHVPDALKGKYADDDILLVIDVIMEYFEKFDDCDDFDDNISAIVTYVTKQLKKDPENVIEASDVLPLVQAELEYEDTLY